MTLRREILISAFEDGFIAVAADEASEYFRGMIKLNETGVFITKCLKDETTTEEIVKLLCEKYEVTEEKALADVNKIVGEFRKVNLIIE